MSNIAFVGEYTWDAKGKDKTPAMILDGLLYYYDYQCNQIKTTDALNSSFHLGVCANPDSGFLSCENARIKFNKTVEKERMKFKNQQIINQKKSEK